MKVISAVATPPQVHHAMALDVLVLVREHAMVSLAHVAAERQPRTGKLAA